MWAATPKPRASLISCRPPECERELVPRNPPEGAGNERTEPHIAVSPKENRGHASRKENRYCNAHDASRSAPRARTQWLRVARRQGPWRPPVRPAHRATDGHPRHHGREYRAAEPRERPSTHGLQHQLDDHQLLAHLRKPAPLRRPRRRSARASSDVPDRPRRLHRIVVRVGHGRHSDRPLRSPRRPGPRCRDALPCSACDHHDRVPREPAGESARRLGSSRRRGSRNRRPRRRSPHRVRRLADDLLRQPAGRSGTRDRRPDSVASRASPPSLPSSAAPMHRSSASSV